MEVILPNSTRSASGVYAIRNRYTKELYVGSAVNLWRRAKKHSADLAAGRHHNRKLQAAWDTRGPAGLEFFVLAYCAKDKVLAEEQWYLDNLTAPYNVCRVSGSRSGTTNSPEHNAAIAAKARARWADPEYKARVASKLKVAYRPKPPETEATRLISAFGKTQPLADWARETGIRRETIAYRLNSGHPPERALSATPLKKGPKK